MPNVKATFSPQVHQSITVQNPLTTNLQNTAVIAESNQFVPVVSRELTPNTKQIKLIYGRLTGCSILYKTVLGRVTTPGNTYTAKNTHKLTHTYSS